MDIREHHSVFKLFIESFKLINSSCGTLLAFFVLVLLGSGFIGAIGWWFHAWKTAVIVGYLYSFFLLIALIKIIAAKAENDMVSLTDVFADSVLPAIYAIILQLVSLMVFAIVGLASIQLGLQDPSSFRFVLGIAGIVIGLMFSFAPAAIALREQGPINALLYSWKMTRRNFLSVLAAWLLLVVFYVILVVGLLAGAFALQTAYGLVLSFQTILMSLSQLTWPFILAIVLLNLVFVFIGLAVFAYWILLFLNLDYTSNGTTSNANEHPEMPALQAEENLILTDEVNAVSEEASKNDFMPHIEKVQVLKASVKSPSNEEALAQHLDQVYQPKPEDVIEYTEEDRMPTILFDEDMAKEIEQTRAQWEAQQKKKNAPRKDGPDNDSNAPIKMSK
ncbi:MAG: hypothetical protein IKO35_01160 [Elusimicrobiaceae bacterium]|nr:hypothetical protein [Elusimicrobiaceae bacterium]